MTSTQERWPLSKRQKAVLLITNYILEYGKDFRTMKYSDSAKWHRRYYRIFMASELCQEIKDNPNVRPIDIVRGMFVMLDDQLQELGDRSPDATAQCNYMLSATEEILKLLERKG